MSNKFSSSLRMSKEETAIMKEFAFIARNYGKGFATAEQYAKAEMQIQYYYSGMDSYIQSMNIISDISMDIINSNN